MNIEVNYTRQADLEIEDTFFEYYPAISNEKNSVSLTVDESLDENEWYVYVEVNSDTLSDGQSVAYFSDYTLACMAATLYGKYLQEKFPNLKVKVVDAEFNATVNSVDFQE